MCIVQIMMSARRKFAAKSVMFHVKHDALHADYVNSGSSGISRATCSPAVVSRSDAQPLASNRT